MKQVILNGKELSKQIEEQLKKRIEKLTHESNKEPSLATIIVGQDPASQTYVRMKGKACERVGIKPIKIELKEDSSTEEVMKVINKLNDDESVDGILLQHPLPRQINERKCFNSIKKEKDVDGVTSAGFGAVSMKEDAFVSATPLGIMKILDYYNIEIRGKEAVVIGRSPILGKPIALLLLNKDATVTIAHSKTENLPKIVKRADIVVACVGKPKFIKKEWIKKGAVIIDAGYNEGNVGDVDLDNVIEKASAYTPVPGGVGPMTIVSLMTQTVDSFEKRVKKL